MPLRSLSPRVAISVSHFPSWYRLLTRFIAFLLPPAPRCSMKDLFVLRLSDLLASFRVACVFERLRSCGR